MNKKELQAKLDELRSRIVELSERDQITDEENVELDALLPEFEGRTAELAAVEAREARIAEVRAATTERHAGYDVPEILKRTSTELDVARASRQELRDAALAILDRDGKQLAARNGDHV